MSYFVLVKPDRGSISESIDPTYGVIVADLVIPPPIYGPYTYHTYEHMYISIIQLLEVAPQDTVKVLGLLLHYFHTLLIFVYWSADIIHMDEVKCISIPPLRNIHSVVQASLKSKIASLLSHAYGVCR